MDSLCIYKKSVLDRALQNSYQFCVSNGAQVEDAILGRKVAARLCDVRSRTTILATAEFGRTAAGNSIDHSCGWLPCRLQRAVKIGKICGDWPDLVWAIFLKS